MTNHYSGPGTVEEIRRISPLLTDLSARAAAASNSFCSMQERYVLGAAAIAASGLTPLDFAIATMRRYAAKAEAWEQIADDETATPNERAEAAKTAREYTQFAMDAAKTAAPYIHPKLTAIAPPEPGQQIAPLPPLQLIVQFEASNPRLKPSL